MDEETAGASQPSPERLQGLMEWAGKHSPQKRVSVAVFRTVCTVPGGGLERTGSMCTGRQDQSSKMRGTTVESAWDHLKYSEAHGCKV